MQRYVFLGQTVLHVHSCCVRFTWDSYVGRLSRVMAAFPASLALLLSKFFVPSAIVA